VPNPGFESYTICPFGSYQIDKVVSWSSAGGSPDYFNACAISGGASVPTNFCGYQNAAGGDAYVGLYTFNKGVSFPNNREHIQASLTTPLSIGVKYYISFDVSFTLDNIEIGYASDKLGILFTNTSYSSGNPPLLSNNSQVFIDTIISDTLNWFHFDGSFVADSAYQNILVGNFFSDANTDTMEVDNSLYTAYYFIDNVCVSSDSTVCLLVNSVNNLFESNSFDIFPNPSNSGFIYFQVTPNLINKEIKYSITNNIGQTVLNNSVILNSDKLQINVSPFSDGVYLIKIQEGQNHWAKKLIISQNQ
jgi:hypothetical protein